MIFLKYDEGGKRRKKKKRGTKKNEKGESTKNEFVILRCTASEKLDRERQ